MKIAAELISNIFNKFAELNSELAKKFSRLLEKVKQSC